MADERLEIVLRRLTADLPMLSAQIAELVYRQQSSYRSVSTEALDRAVKRNTELATAALRRGELDTGESMDKVLYTVRERFELGIPVAEVIRAFALCVWKIHQRFLELSAEEELDQAALIAGSNVLWSLGDAITTRVVVGYHELDLQQSLQDAQRRSDLVRWLLAGRVSPAELQKAPFVAGARYAAVRCVTPGGFIDSERRRLEATGSLPRVPAVLAVMEQECLGVVARAPKPAPGGLVAIGPSVPLTEIAASFEVADRVCHVATHLGLTGVQSLETMTWRVAAVDRPELAELLRQRFLEPLRAEGAFGADLEASVRSFLSHGLSIPKAAADLNLHVNTLRYRLRRFNELTHSDLDDPRDLLDVVWALELAELPPRTLRL